MYRVIVTDLDETLLNSKHRISRRDMQSIDLAIRLGVRFVLATGRGFRTVENDLKLLNLYGVEDEYVISFNGAIITENKDSRILYRNSMDFDKISAIYKFGLDKDVCIHVYTVDTTYAFNVSEAEREYCGERLPLTDIYSDNIDFLRDTPIIKALYMNTDAAYLRELREQMGGMLDGVEVSFSSNRYMEFNNTGINKGLGIRKLAEILDIGVDEIIAVGDNYNDLPMIKEAGLGIGVANVNPEIADQCDYILTSTNDENPMTEVINKFILR